MLEDCSGLFCRPRPGCRFTIHDPFALLNPELTDAGFSPFDQALRMRILFVFLTGCRAAANLVPHLFQTLTIKLECRMLPQIQLECSASEYIINQ